MAWMDQRLDGRVMKKVLFNDGRIWESNVVRGTLHGWPDGMGQ